MNSLSQYLSQQKITQEDFARLLGVRQPTVSRWCVDGAKGPDLDLAIKVQKHTGGAVPITCWPRFSALREIREQSVNGAAE